MRLTKKWISVLGLADDIGRIEERIIKLNFKNIPLHSDGMNGQRKGKFSNA